MNSGILILSNSLQIYRIPYKNIFLRKRNQHQNRIKLASISQIVHK